MGKCLVFIGQDLGAIGGLDDYTDGYCDFFPTPAGITTYTSWSPGQNSYGYINKGNDGLREKANWGAGDMGAFFYLQDDKFNNVMISIGLSMVDHEKQVASGARDQLIRDLATWIKQTQRKVFLRIGYEFDGWEWNHYSRKDYLSTWKRAHQIFQEMEVDNVAFVWQSKGTGTDQKTLEKWYPGDDLVDWVGYSYFGSPDEEMLIFARRHKKPVFIAEATPVQHSGNLYFNADLTDEQVAKRVWSNWFEPFFQTIEDNQDIIKAFSYINANWPAQPMWINNPTFQQVDSRIQVSPFVTTQWKATLENPRYIQRTNQ